MEEKKVSISLNFLNCLMWWLAGKDELEILERLVDEIKEHNEGY